MHDTMGVADWLSSYGPTYKIEIDLFQRTNGNGRVERNGIFLRIFGNNGILRMAQL